MNVIDELKWRGMFFDETEGLTETLAKDKVTFYNGFDPTGASLHIGHLVPIMGMAHLQRAGHSPIALVGGGTGMIGDPSGKSEERKLLTKEQIAANQEGIRQQLAAFLDFNAKTNPARILNNAEWLTTISLMDFLRDVGKNFTVNYMLAKDSVKRRIEQERGISFTEFSYMLLQSFDFVMLYDKFHCTLQTGGSDQWGNITAGVDLVKSMRGASAHGLVFPLLLTPSGTKFGKTEAGAVWLDPKLTSPFRFYQYWFNSDDRDVSLFLKFFTFLSQTEIAALENAVQTAPEKREAQRTLARHVTQMVHGNAELEKAERASQILFGAEISGMSLRDILDIFSDVPSSEIKLDGEMPLIELLVASQVAPSKSEARRLLQSGGIYLNNRRVTDAQMAVTRNDTIEGQVLVLRKGAKEYRLVRVSG